MSMQRAGSKPRNRIYESRGEPAFQAALVIVFAVMSVTFLYPYWHVAVTSFTSPDYASASGFKLWPRQWSWDAYIHMFMTECIIPTIVVIMLIVWHSMGF